MRSGVEAPLVEAGVVSEGFVDSVALNLYHDGSEGIQARLLLACCMRAWAGGGTCTCHPPLRSPAHPPTRLPALQSHYDDAERFARPIYSLRLYSDSRLSFGTQLYG